MWYCRISHEFLRHRRINAILIINNLYKSCTIFLPATRCIFDFHVYFLLTRQELSVLERLENQGFSQSPESNRILSWTRRELNSDLIHAKDAFCRYTTGPNIHNSLSPIINLLSFPCLLKAERISSI